MEVNQDIVLSFRVNQRVDQPLDYDLLSKQTVTTLIQVRDLLRKEARELFGSDFADEVISLHASVYNREAHVIDNMLRAALERVKLKAALNQQIFKQMSIQIDKDAEDLPQDWAVPVTIHVNFEQAKSPKEAMELVEAELMGGEYEFTIHLTDPSD